MPLCSEPVWSEKHRMRRGFSNASPLMYCRACKGDTLFKCLPTHCPGRQLTDAEEAAIMAGTLDFKSGEWLMKGKT